MMKTEHAFGYLSFSQDGAKVLVKADKIVGIDRVVDNEKNEYSIIRFASKDVFFIVRDTHEEILEQLECIHPTLR